jgi:hypothetical protein
VLVSDLVFVLGLLVGEVSAPLPVTNRLPPVESGLEVLSSRKPPAAEKFPPVESGSGKLLNYPWLTHARRQASEVNQVMVPDSLFRSFAVGARAVFPSRQG